MIESSFHNSNSCQSQLHQNLLHCRSSYTKLWTRGLGLHRHWYLQKFLQLSSQISRSVWNFYFSKGNGSFPFNIDIFYTSITDKTLSSYLEGRVGIPLTHWTPSHICTFPRPGFPTSYVVVVFVFSELRWEVTVRLVDICEVLTITV